MPRTARAAAAPKAKPRKPAPTAKRKQPPARKVPPRAPERALSPDETARVGFFAKVIDGPHKGRYGVVHAQTEHTMILRTRDAEDEMLHVQPEHLRPDVAGRR